MGAPVEKDGSSRTAAAEEDDSIEKRSSRSSSRSGSQNRPKNSKKSTTKPSFSRNNGRSLDNLWNKNTTNSLSFVRKNPMILACSYGNYYALDYLLTKGLDTEIRDSLENTPLILAAEKNHVGILQLLLEHNNSSSNLQAENKQGLTAMQVAMENRHKESGIMIYRYNQSSTSTRNSTSTGDRDRDRDRQMRGAVRSSNSNY